MLAGSVKICSISTLSFVGVALAGAACQSSDPATTSAPLTSAAPVAANAPGSVAADQASRILTRPDSVLVVYSPAERRVAAWSPNAVEVWRLTLPPGEDLIGFPVAAADSTVYVRLTNKLYAIGADGKLAWQSSLPPAVGDPAVYSPAALSNSGVVLAKTAGQLVAFDHRGVEMWQFNMPLNEELRTPPRVAENGTIYVATSGGVAAVSPGGVLNWYRQRSSGPAPTTP